MHHKTTSDSAGQVPAILVTEPLPIGRAWRGWLWLLLIVAN